MGREGFLVLFGLCVFWPNNSIPCRLVADLEKEQDAMTAILAAGGKS